MEFRETLGNSILNDEVKVVDLGGVEVDPRPSLLGGYIANESVQIYEHLLRVVMDHSERNHRQKYRRARMITFLSGKIGLKVDNWMFP